MFTKQNLIATIVAAIVMFFLGYLIWGIATVSFFEGHTLNDVMKNPPDMLFIFISNLISAFALGTIYSKWSSNHSFGDGFNFGIWIGIFAGIGYALLWYATGELMDLTGHLVDGIVTLIYFAIVGGVIGLMYKVTAPKAAAA